MAITFNPFTGNLDFIGEPFGELLIDSSQAGVIYVGKAPTGSLQTAPVWSIRKSTYDSFGVLLTQQLATNVAWVNRYTVPYI